MTRFFNLDPLFFYHYHSVKILQQCEICLGNAICSCLSRVWIYALSFLSERHREKRIHFLKREYNKQIYRTSIIMGH